MRRLLASVTAPRRWRRRRVARIALAATLVVAAPFAGRPGPDAPAGTPPADDRHAADLSRIRVVPVPLADPALADLLQPGDLVDLVGTAQPGGHTGGGHSDSGGAGPDGALDPASDAAAVPTVVARAARVRDTPDGRAGSRSILVEVPHADAARLAATAAVTPLAVLLHR